MNITFRVKNFFEKIPWILELLWYANDILKNKWHYSGLDIFQGNRLSIDVSNWFDQIRNTKRLSELPKRKALFFTGGYKIMEHNIAMSLILYHRNCDIDLVHTEHMRADRSQLEKYSIRKFNYYYKKALEVKSDLHGYRILPLSEIPFCKISSSELSHKIVEEAKKQSEIDTIYIKRKETTDIEGEDKLDYQYYYDKNIDAMMRIYYQLTNQKYDMVILPHGAVREYGAVYRMAELLNIPVGSFEFWGKPGTINISFGDRVMDMNTEELWRDDYPHQLSPQDHMAVLQTLKEREIKSGNTNQLLLDQLNLDNQIPIVLICPNVPFDGIFVGKNSVFSSMKEWLIRTIEFFLDKPDIRVLIRSHPHEIKHKVFETTEMIIAGHFEELPPHFTVIFPEDRISTYDLMEFADLGVVYSSTTAIEMSVKGVPTVNASQFHYSNKGFTYDPISVQDYFGMIEKILANPQSYILSSREKELALSYMNVFFNKFQSPFPWQFSDFWERIDDWSIARVVSKEGDELFGRTIDNLIGRGN